jgi:hypothetical protein
LSIYYNTDHKSARALSIQQKLLRGRRLDDGRCAGRRIRMSQKVPDHIGAQHAHQVDPSAAVMA